MDASSNYKVGPEKNSDFHGVKWGPCNSGFWFAPGKPISEAGYL